VAVLVDLLEARLVDVGVGVGVSVVGVGVLVLDVLVIVSRVGMDMGLALVLVLVGVRGPRGCVRRSLRSSHCLVARYWDGLRHLWCARVEVLDVAQGLVEQDCHVGVIEAVDRVTARAAANHQVEIPQDPQLMGDRRLGHLHCGRQLADAAPTLTEATENLHSARRPQPGHDPRHVPVLSTSDAAS